MKTKIFITFLFIFALCGCENNTENTPEITNGLIACWVMPQSEGNEVFLYQRANILGNSAGIQFLNDSALIERKNSGWCGTPPIAYDNFDGQYRMENDSTIIIHVAYWGGMEQRRLKILNLTDSALKIEILSQETISVE
jgi:uncharacterized lipoprotein NlpE involved in copper resistance